MNKKKKVIIGVVLFVLAVAVGYALFSDTLTINGTATAKGEFELTYLCEKAEEGGSTAECSVSGNTVTTTSTFSKPNDAVGYYVTVTNTGSIPAVLKTVTSPNNYDVNNVDKPTAGGDEAYIDTTTMLAAYYHSMINNDELYGDSAFEEANIVIEPGNSINIEIIHLWLDSSQFSMEQPAIPAEGAKINYNLTFGFEQKTN